MVDYDNVQEPNPKLLSLNLLLWENLNFGK